MAEGSACQSSRDFSPSGFGDLEVLKFRSSVGV